MKKIHGGSRDAAVLLCVIACLAVASVLIALSVQSALRGRREARLQLQLRQTELLCEAGVMRAASKLGAPEEYLGEQWRPELELENYHSALVDIQVVPTLQSDAPPDSGARQVTVTARLDSYLDNDGPMQRTHRFTVTRSPTFNTSLSLENL